MFATYNATKPGKTTLNIRATPGGAVIDTMADGQTAPVEVIERGWCKLENGYADARFLTITAEPPTGFTSDNADDDNATAETGGSENPETGGSDDDCANDGNTKPENGDDGKTAEPPTGDGNDAAELRKMTNPQLYKLAQDSGIKVKAGMNKDALVEAILAGADD